MNPMRWVIQQLKRPIEPVVGLIWQAVYERPRAALRWCSERSS